MSAAKKLKEHEQVSKGVMFFYPANDLVIVGLDCPPSDGSLVDERIRMEPRDTLVRSILRKGILEPVIVVKNEDRVEVVDGRQRVRAARAANLVLENEGSEERIKVPCVMRKGEDELGLMECMIIANEHRTEDSPLNKAKKAARLLSRNGGDEQATAEVFGVSKQTIKNWLTLLEASSEVKKAVDTGKLTPTAAYELARLPKEDQGAALEKLKETGKLDSRSVKRESQKARNVRSATTRPTLREIKEVIENKSVSPAKLAALRWVLGEIETAEFLGMEVTK